MLQDVPKEVGLRVPICLRRSVGEALRGQSVNEDGLRTIVIEGLLELSQGRSGGQVSPDIA